MMLAKRFLAIGSGVGILAVVSCSKGDGQSQNLETQVLASGGASAAPDVPSGGDFGAGGTAAGAGGSDTAGGGGGPGADGGGSAVAGAAGAPGDGEGDMPEDWDAPPPPFGDHSESGLAFSHHRGIYEEPFALTISHPTALEVLYTLDSSDPLSAATPLRATLPLTLSIEPSDTTNRYLAPGVIVRAVPVTSDASYANVSTHTYLYLNRIEELSPDGVSPGGAWPEPTSTGRSQRIDYGLDAEVLEDPDYAADIQRAFADIPSVSLVTDLSNLFDPETGIFVNADKRSEDPDPSGAEQAWERPVSFEVLTADGSQTLQANAGARIRGGFSRDDANAKHAFKLYFRGIYGPGRLRFPLYGEEGVGAFDRLDLRTSGNYSWSFEGLASLREKNTMNRDVFSRDLQRQLGQPYTRSRYYHLFLNGVYWGLFQSQERAEAAFAASYLGGTRAEYDVIKSNKITNSEVEIEVTDGTIDTWQAVYDFCLAGFSTDDSYYALQGMGPDGVRDPSMKVHVDIDNLINFMLVIFYTGNFDGPVSSFYDNEMPNNFVAISSRTNLDQGFVFFTHDNEHTLRIDGGFNNIGLEEDRVNIGTEDFGSGLMTVESLARFHPQWLHFRLSDNPKYRERFAARADAVFTEQLSTSSAQALFQSRASEIEYAIIAESARWGDARGNESSEPHTKVEDWIPAVTDIMDNFFPARGEIVQRQLDSAGL